MLLEERTSVPSVEERTTAERIARNDATFRDANERIRAAAGEYQVEGSLPVFCECADGGCTTLLRLTTQEYEHVRERGDRFVNAPGHQVAGEGWVQVVEDHDHYLVIEKLGRAGEVAEALDPRRKDGEA